MSKSRVDIQFRTKSLAEERVPVNFGGMCSGMGNLQAVGIRCLSSHLKSSTTTFTMYYICMTVLDIRERRRRLIRAADYILFVSFGRTTTVRSSTAFHDPNADMFIFFVTFIDSWSTWFTALCLQAKTLPELYEIVNAYKPDIVWSDGGMNLAFFHFMSALDGWKGCDWNIILSKIVALFEVPSEVWAVKKEIYQQILYGEQCFWWTEIPQILVIPGRFVLSLPNGGTKLDFIQDYVLPDRTSHWQSFAFRYTFFSMLR